MAIYIIKTTICLLFFMAFYKLILEKEKMPGINRFYLLSSVLVSFLIPLIPVQTWIDWSLDAEKASTITLIYSETGGGAPDSTFEFSLTKEFIAVVIYFVVTAILLFRFVLNLYKIWRKSSMHTIVPYHKAKLVLLPEDTLPYTFMNFIFVSEKSWNSEGIDKDILLHEYTHASQWHTMDILSIELMKIVLWMHPIIYMYRKAIELNHEFLADDAVVRTEKTVKSYQNLLLELASNHQRNYLASNINFLVTKKRLEMMTKRTSAKRALLCLSGLLPFLLVMVMTLGNPMDLQSQDDKAGWEQKKDEYFKDAIIRFKTEDGKMVEKPFSQLTEKEKAKLPGPPPPPPAPPGMESKTPVMVPLKKGAIVNVMDNGGIRIKGGFDGSEPAPPPPPPPAPPAKSARNKAGAPDAPPPPPPPPAKPGSKESVAPPPPPPPAKPSRKAAGAPGVPPPPPPPAHMEAVPPPPPPPPPPPVSLEDLVEKENTTFFLDGKSISKSEAKELIKRKGQSVNIQTNNGETKVYFKS